MINPKKGGKRKTPQLWSRKFWCLSERNRLKKEFEMIRLVLIVLTSLLLMASSVFAQGSPIDKGSILAEGGFAFSSLGGDSYKYLDENLEEQDGGATLITFNPRGGYFVMPGLAVGGTIILQKMSLDYGAPDNATQTDFGIGPGVKYYFNLDKSRTEVKGAIYPYVTGAFVYNTRTANSGSANAEDYKWSGTAIIFEGGGIYMVSNAVGIFGQVGYEMTSMKQSEPAANEPADGWESIKDHELAFQIGLSYFIY